SRTIAATQMNATSSRSHGVFTLILTQKRHDVQTNMDTEKVSRISLVDLAGSERAKSTGATGAQLKEGANINRSLTTLGKVISALADASDTSDGSGGGKKKKKKKDEFIPYRDSVLTWLLKDSLGGNSRTSMIAAISPADYDETLSTLRYAYAAKRIQNKAVVNEDPNARMIRELKEELLSLRTKLAVYDPEAAAAPSKVGGPQGKSAAPTTGSGASNPGASTTSGSSSTPGPGSSSSGATGGGDTERESQEMKLRSQIHQSEKIMAELSESWEDKLKQTKALEEVRAKMLEDLGIAVEKGNVGLHTPKKIPHLVNLCEDPLMSECLVYQLKPGITRGLGKESEVIIKLSGDTVVEGHCYFENTGTKVILHPKEGAITMVNGRRIESPKRLRSGYRVILGERHIFRFNYPEEYRKRRARDERRRSAALPQTLSFADASGTGSVGPEPMDWNYALREAKLVDARSDVSRDELDAQLQGMREEMEAQKTAFEERLAAMGDAGEEVEKHKAVMERLLEAERERMATEIDMHREAYDARVREAAEVGAAGGDARAYLGWRVYTPRERRLVEWVIQRMRGLRVIRMAETILAGAVLVKEANVMARELGRPAAYQFCVVNGGPGGKEAQHRSFWEAEVGVAGGLIPDVGILVIDRRHDTAYIWSMRELQRRVERMRALYHYMDRPAYARHFNMEEPFYASPAPHFTYMGRARVHLRNLLAMIGQRHVHVPILGRWTGGEVGKVTVGVLPIRQARRRLARSEEEEGEAEEEALLGELPVPGVPSKLKAHRHLLLEVGIEEMIELDERLWTQVHGQFRLSCFGAVRAHGPTDRIYATEPFSGFGSKDGDNGKIMYGWVQSLGIPLTRRVLRTLTRGHLEIEVYGQAQPRLLAAWERGDQESDATTLSTVSIPDSSGPTTPTLLPTPVPSGPSTSTAQTNPVWRGERRSDEELVTEERHDVLAWLQILELGPDGEYRPVPVVTEHAAHDAGTFLLHQGLQRRMRLHVVHASGRQLTWTGVMEVRAGRLRSQDSRGHITEGRGSGEELALPLLNPMGYSVARYGLDGTAELVGVAGWDSSLHDSPFLDRVTGSGERVWMVVRWVIGAERATVPLTFTMDVALRIQARPPPPKIRGRGRATSDACRRVGSKRTELFQVTLTPPITKRLAELWRANTASTYVRGEEFLGGWRPRGVALVSEYRVASEMFRKREGVEEARQYLGLRELLGSAVVPTTKALESAPQAICERIIGLWLKWPFDEEWGGVWGEEAVMIRAPSPSIRMCTEDGSSVMGGMSRRGTGSDTVAKRGYLLYPTETMDWVPRWFVIRRPYMFMYTAADEVEELGVINLTLVRVDFKSHLEKMLQRQHVFAIYTKNNAYMLQASGGREEMDEWIRHIDPWYHVLRTGEEDVVHEGTGIGLFS
ncbi:MAG: hypothetical protein DHS80DRAFT_17413, partial [Piptocephalis tieghemiana]